MLVAADEVHAIHPRFILIQLLVTILPHNAFCRVRTVLYRLAGFKIGKGALILGKLTLTSDGPMAKMFSVGEYCRINSPFYAELNAPIVIGNRVAIGHNTVFVTTDHDTSDAADRAGPAKVGGIVIEDGAMIGASVTVLPGVTIGRGSVVAAGALVTQSVLANRVVGGVPARTVKTLDG
jgi:carbonic anhydrase/acetyltransferase-like protein (isoleucine patch superfamily)